ncbi:MAG: ferredoxin family protein [Planctomycetales bacterium]
MPSRITVVVSQGQSHNPAKRKLEEDIVANLLGERGIEVAVLPHLYDLTADGTGILCLQGISGNMIVLSWMFPRAARWILNRNGIQGHEGTTLLVPDTDNEEEEPDEADDDTPRVIDSLAIPDRKVYCIDLRISDSLDTYLEEIRRIANEASTTTVQLTDWISGDAKPEHVDRLTNPLPGNIDGNGSVASAPLPKADGSHLVVDEETDRRWYPVIDFSRCTNCMECIDFCLFGVYGVDRADTILVEQPDNCRKGCPACSRVCPENAIIFPQHKTPVIAGSAGVAESLKIDLSKLFGAPEADAVDVAVLERDEQLLLVGRDTVGHAVGLAKRQPNLDEIPKDKLDQLIDELDEMDL